jgi:hypothetical protein
MLTQEEKRIIIKAVGVIERIKPGDKLTLRTGFLEIDTKLNLLIRWFSGDSKYVTMRHLQYIVENALELDIKINVDGLKNLQQTYSGNKYVQDTIDMMIHAIETN